MQEKEIGKISHYFGHIGVGIIELTDALKVGDSVRIKGHTTDLTEMVESMQLDHNSVGEAAKGQAVGIKVAAKVHPNDKVYKIIP
ncbi:MAG: hypothetical protein KKH28_15025 [Elusimicrobia bacterium]|nr:hypothetical protein [Elusimicrobiota bacterium]